MTSTILEKSFINAKFVFFLLTIHCPSSEELSPEAKEIESAMIEIGYEAALIGHPLDGADLSYIRFTSSKNLSNALLKKCHAEMLKG